jgi:hypothetical protein
LENLRQTVRESLIQLGEENDKFSAEQADLSARLLASVQHQQEVLKKRRKLELRYVQLHSEKAELVDREMGSIAEIAALEEAQEKASGNGSDPEAASGVDPLHLDLSSDFLDFDAWSPAALLASTVKGSA